MRRVLRLSFAIAVVIALAVPSAFADDPLIQPPWPHAVSPVHHTSFWQVVRIVLFNA